MFTSNRRRRIRARNAFVAALLLLLVTACPAEPDPEPDSDPQPTPEPTPDVHPLTGLMVDDPAVLERPVLVVKIDNVAPARPQTGVEHADIVMVELVEGATRLIAFYHSTDPGVVGPVRSGRLLEADMLPPFSPVFAMSGAHGPVNEALRDALPAVYEEGQTDGWMRAPDRSAPHNLYLTAADLWDAAPDLPLTERFWAFDEDTPGGGSDTESFTVDYPQAGSSGWEWDGERWVRLQDALEHVTADGERLAADTVVVVRLQTTGEERRPVETIGEGDATVFRDGQRFEARWRKPSRGEHMEIVSPDGADFAIAPGQTWVELLPTDGQLSADDPEA